MNANLKNLYIFTGKGGVGKTTMALSLYHHLKSKKLNVSIYELDTGGFDDEEEKVNLKKEKSSIRDEINLLKIRETAIEYMGRKLHSQTIAKWISTTKFFQALINMIPSFNYVIYFGKILQLIKDNKEIIIIDAPSTGHLLNMFNALYNFKKIFSNGVLFQDINKIIETLSIKNFLEIFIVSKADPLIHEESMELLKATKDLNLITQTSIVFNSVYSDIENLDCNDIPLIIKEKISQELALKKENSLRENNEIKNHYFPYSMKLNQDEKIIELSNYWNKVVSNE